MPHPTPPHPPNVHENARPDKGRAPTKQSWETNKQLKLFPIMFGEPECPQNLIWILYGLSGKRFW